MFIRAARKKEQRQVMSTPIPIACLALSGTAGSAAAASAEPGRDAPHAVAVSNPIRRPARSPDPHTYDGARRADAATHARSTHGLRYDMKM